VCRVCGECARATSGGADGECSRSGGRDTRPPGLRRTPRSPSRRRSTESVPDDCQISHTRAFRLDLIKRNAKKHKRHTPFYFTARHDIDGRGQPRPACCRRPRPRTTRRPSRLWERRSAISNQVREPCTTRSVRRPVSIARRSPVRAAASSRPVQLGLGLLVRGVGRGGALLHVEGLVGLVDACAIVK